METLPVEPVQSRGAIASKMGQICEADGVLPIQNTWQDMTSVLV